MSAIFTAVEALYAARLAARDARPNLLNGRRFPSRHALAAVIDDLSAAIYPRRLGGYRPNGNADGSGDAEGENDFVAARLERALIALTAEVESELDYWQGEADAAFEPGHARTIVDLFATTLGDIRRLIDSDVEAAFLGDPAARSVDEILICYPGAVASLHHRIAHQLHTLGAAIVARIISELANERTGIDIHPGATIGASFFIDHGTGVVIGETAIIGERVRLYQHVTLGARSPLGAAQLTVRDRHARHPIVEDDVVIYAGATILGRVVIGRGSTIGGNVWLLSDVPAKSVVVQPEALTLDPRAGLSLRETLLRAAS
ncbi:serine O-acetyltransferase EpsC [Sphingomonas sp.]|uniref:serine O-acetyltransferase EpsC n=1 Tax=Sphingomonas sp. TaxID=28214 RepID=UPI002CA18658|nr:serine O-acetyltransferase EpsC [Sphingomonas sp.]HWK36545.1 serine O-acetyltransferase EpsC [Sphingomonas sp.]